MLSVGSSPLPLSQRVAGGAACGAAALALNHIPAFLLSSESPAFAFGGAFVLFAFWRLGLVPGLVAAFVGYAVDTGVREVMLAAMVLYAVEGLVSSWLAGRARSIVVADILFWLTAGALLNALIYGWWMEMPIGYVILLLLKQLLNGVMNAMIADGASRLSVVRRWLGVPLGDSRPWQEVSFDRAVPVVLVPTTLVILLLARASFATRYNGTAADLRQAVTSAAESAEQIFRSRQSSAAELTLPGGDARAATEPGAAASLRTILAAESASREGAAQLLDHTGRVVVSTSPRWTPGAPRDADVALALRARRLVSVSAREDKSYAGRLGVDPRLTLAQPVAGFPFVVLVDEPLSTVYQAMIPALLALIALMLGALLAVYSVARALGAQLSAPLLSIGAVARDLAEGHDVPREVLADFDASPVREIRTLAAQLGVVDTALRARRETDAQAVEESEAKYQKTLEQLVQAQKLEGIGRLAGGIAHDFNNLLMPILGYTDLAISTLPPGSPALRDLAVVRLAAGRAREVLAQLLAFSRAQVLDLNRVDLVGAVAEFEPLLRRTLGERIDLLVIAEPGVVVDADRSKVQQVLMNLVVNAADAMPQGGRVEVRVGIAKVGLPDPAEPDPLAAGAYGVIIVSDTGVGMDAETQRRSFEPFFTTKPPGRGTGLGLSTAYGIVRQHRGSIVVDSAVGAGTRMRVLLPLAAPAPLGSPATRQPARAASVPRTPDITATVLVVEDERAVRELVRAVLMRSGYRVLTAVDGDDALKRAAAYEEGIDLLLTDVVMPGLNGRELALRFRAARPDARVLFMSGYAADVIAVEGTLPGDADLLEKPFTPDELEARVRACLNR